MMDKLKVIIDSRERNPLLFPDVLVVFGQAAVCRSEKPKTYLVDTKVQTMRAGDYTLEGYEKLVLVERKAGIEQELMKNTLSGDRERFFRALGRLAETASYPYLYIEALPAAFWHSGQGDIQEDHGGFAVTAALDSTLEACSRLGIGLIWGGRRSASPLSRRKLGEIILRIMVHRVLAEPKT